jgi:hypothetical protein
MTLFEVLLALFAVAAVLFAWRLFHPRRGVEINERGIRVRDLRLGWIRWDEIEGAYHPARDDDRLRLRLRMSDRLARRVSQRDRTAPSALPGSIDVQLDLSGADITPFELLQMIMANREGGTPPVPVS